VSSCLHSSRTNHSHTRTGTKTQENADDDNTDSPHAAIEVKKALLNPIRMLFTFLIISTNPTNSVKFVLEYLNFMNEIVALHWNSTTRYETLSVRSLVGILMGDFIGVRMLSEQGQIGAIQELANKYLK